ncbi:hypothetical protein, partial [Acinetobacter baumannii]|uniref:hypothetical protein n=1 Tax=Acinetobacter baumannii TaxID=470 RepID=UPI000E5A76B5
MLKPIIILVAIGAIGLVGYKVFAQKDEPTQINETVLLINDANKSVEEADHTIEKANASFQKIPLNEYIVKLLYYSYKIRKKLEIT